jgi:zinc protease
MIVRRRIGIVLLVLFAWLSLDRQAMAQSGDRSFTLDNGLRVFLHERRGLPLLHVVTAFDVGSKDETDETSGLVHLLEHCILFRGSAARSGAEVGTDIRRHGAYFNAHTGLDLAVFEISLPSEYAEFALRNQKDILFGLELGQAELDDEKEVILEELNQMEDDPARVATDLVLQDLFAGHPYGRSVYGRRNVIQAATAEAVLDFYGKYFAADNCAMAVVGDFESARMERLVREIFGPLPATGFHPESLPMAAPLKKSVTQRLERDVEDGYLYLAFIAPDYNHSDQYAVTLLAEILGRGINPLLPGFLRRERESVQTVNMAYLGNRFGGAVVVSIKASPKDLPFLERSAVSSLKQARNESYSKKDFQGDQAIFAYDHLESAKLQIQLAAARAGDSGLQVAGAMVRHILLNTRESPPSFLEEIGRIESSDLRKAASKYFSRGEFAVVTVVPAKGAK